MVKLKTQEVKRAMERANMSKHSLAAALDIHPSYLTRLMDNERPPSPKIRSKLQEIFSENDWDVFFERI